jgi:hypothetical protein
MPLDRRWTLLWSLIGVLLVSGAFYVRGAYGDDFFGGFLAGVGSLSAILFIWFTFQSIR